jgi:nucleoid-associated protein YgaU
LSTFCDLLSLVRNARLSAQLHELEKTDEVAAKVPNLETSNATLSQRLATEQKALADLRVKFVQEVRAREEKLAVMETSDASQGRTQSNALNSLITSLSAQNASLRAAQSATPVVEKTQAATCVPVSNKGQLKSLHTLITSLSNQNAQLRVSARATAQPAAIPVTTTTAPTCNTKSLNTLITSLSNQNSGLRAQVRQLESAPATTTAPVSGYVIEAGDTLSSIALELYGDADRWRDIAAANGISDGETISLKISQVIKIP